MCKQIHVQETVRKKVSKFTIKWLVELDPIIEDEVTVQSSPCQRWASPLSTQFIITDVAL